MEGEARVLEQGVEPPPLHRRGIEPGERVRRQQEEGVEAERQRTLGAELAEAKVEARLRRASAE